jgi:DNA-directed RNA polymerase subunit RPC12/RpoP
MKLDVDNVDIDLFCSTCSKEFKERFGRLKTQQQATCPHCGSRVLVDAEKAARKIESIEEDLRRLGFR